MSPIYTPTTSNQTAAETSLMAECNFRKCQNAYEFLYPHDGAEGTRYLCKSQEEYLRYTRLTFG